jgi:mycothiol synthase
VTSNTDIDIAVSNRLTSAERDRVLQIDAHAARTDGVPPLDDQVRLDLSYGDPSTRHVLARLLPNHAAVGYAHVRLPRAGGRPSAGHVVVDPSHRSSGVGSALLATLAEVTGRDRLRVWAHGDLPPARTIADRERLSKARELWQLRRGLQEPLPEPHYPPDVSVRTFVPGVDEPAWLAVNAAAFADHPEQGSVTAADLTQRIQQPDFDPAGFFLAERDGELLGFHWTKVHLGTDQTQPVGEVYVLGVDPAAQGLGLGKALALTGLRHLATLGLQTVTLYVEAANPSAVGLYTGLGFTLAGTDVLYAGDVTATG